MYTSQLFQYVGEQSLVSLIFCSEIKEHDKVSCAARSTAACLCVFVSELCGWAD